MPIDPLERLSTIDLLTRMNNEDAQVTGVVAAVMPAIARVVDAVVSHLGAGGRLHYFGAGTSGRLAVLDAAECPPTFGVEPDQLVAHLAGGPPAFLAAVEGAEDSYEHGQAEVREARIGPTDAVIGIAASGGTPYVLGAVRAAREAGAFTGAIACVAESPLAAAVDVAISLPVGPEVLDGSTRLKAGTAQKLVLNMISTATFAHLGHVHRGRMIDVRPTNSKLRLRAVGIVADLAEVDPERAAAVLEAAAWRPKLAVLMAVRGLQRDRAETLLKATGGQLWQALEISSEPAR